MKRRSKYMMFIIGMLLSVNIGGTLLLITLFELDVISLELSRFYFMVANYLIGIIIVLCILYEGRFYRSTYIVAIAFIIGRILDAYMYYTFPSLQFNLYFLYMYSGGFLLIFSLVFLNAIRLRERFTFLLMAVAGLMMLRVLFSTDIILMYVDKYVIISRRNIVYFLSTMGFYIPMLVFLIMALNSISIDNHNWHRSSNMYEYKRKRVDE